MRVGTGRLTGNAPVTFSWQGEAVTGRRGDTVASALLAGGRRLVARSFKYHRPRGVVACGSEEPSALVTVGAGAGRRPNVRATVQEIWDGLDVRGQNAWPSLERDAMALNDRLSAFIGAGFYYKTFMWPRAAWERLYEPVIRRAAGLGALSGDAAPDANDRAFAHCDLLVVGAGPAGLMAALTAARAGARVILATEEVRCGGRLLSEAEEVDGRPGHLWALDAEAELRGLGARVMTRTTVTGAYDHGTYGALERSGLHVAPEPDLPPETFWRIHAPACVLATGALERGIAFADNDRPGIMLAGAVRGYLHRYGVAPGQTAAVLGNNDDAWRTARDLQAAGIETTLLDTRDFVEPAFDGRVLTGVRVIETEGRQGLVGLTVSSGGRTHSLRCRTLGVSGGWNPAVHLTCHLGARPEWDEDLATFLPREGAVPGMLAAGAARGRFSTAACLADGGARAAEALGALGIDAAPAEAPRAEDGAYAIAPIWEMKGKGRAFLDLGNDVTTKDVRLAAQEGFAAPEHMKRYTTQGMAPDQGKTSNVGALAVLADATGRGIPETGTTTFRPPFVPISIAAMGAGASGAGFAPERETTALPALRAQGAPTIEAGLWHRPSYVPKDGERTWREACDREARTVRRAVGLCDVSTLGKIELQGPDVPAFLDFVYSNRMASLKPGRVRYGLMLREDGHVLDDGTCARLAEDRWMVTTTTGAAGQVMRHMEHAHQVLRPDLDLAFVSATEQWAQFAVAGPKAREALTAVCDVPDLPFMGCADLEVGGVPGRLFRISFSGELGYEVAVPAGHGAALWAALQAAVEGRGGCLYGMEALNVLRIEKGFLTHAEIDGRTTAADLGMGRMAGAKPHIGRPAAAREGLSGPGRAELVGLRPARTGEALPAGGHLFERDLPAVRENSLGRVTSTCYSPTLGDTHALALLKDGRARLGDRLRVVDHMRGVETPCRVVAPCAYDPDGGRMRG